jgi:CelD/BcsL family acetyltransferase involved in cellulose biosynthesis
VDLNISICSDPSKWLVLKAKWDCLLCESQQKNIFLTWEWMSTWWEVFGDKYKLHIILVEDSESNLIGIAPFKIAKRKYFGICPRNVLEFIGTGESPTPEALDIIASIGLEGKVASAIVATIKDNKMFDTIDLWPYADNVLSLFTIKFALENQGRRSNLTQYSSCPVTYLPNDWETYLSSKSRNFRKKMKEYLRVCQRDIGLKLVRCGEQEFSQYGLEPLMRLHTVQRNGKSNSFSNEHNITFHKKIAELFLNRDWLRLFYLQANEKIVAGIYCYYHAGKYYYYQSGRDLQHPKYRLGYVILNLAVKEAITEGATKFNFLTGGEAYKFRWATEVEHSMRLRSWGQRWLLPQSIYSLRSFVKSVCKYIKGTQKASLIKKSDENL